VPKLAVENSLENIKFRHSGYLFLLIVLIFLEGAFFFYYGVSRHYNYLSSINDLGHFDQAIWGFLEGKPFLNTDVFNKSINRIGIHFDPVLVFFVPLYLLVPSVIWLIFAQSIALPLAALPIYFLAERVCLSARVAFFWAAAYLFSPFVLSAASWDFHPVSLAVPFIALSFLSVEKKNYSVLFFACLFILLCKEHFGLLVIGFGLLWFFRHRCLKNSLTLVLLGTGHFFLVMKIIMPAFSPSGKHLMLSSNLGNFSRYGWLGNSVEEIVMTIMTQPVETIQHVLFAMDGWVYLTFLLIPLLCLPILGCEFLLPGLGDLFANLLSANTMPRSILAYHSVTLIPVFVVAAIYGSRRTNFLFKKIVSWWPAFVVLLVTLLYGWAFFPFFSLPGSAHFWEPKRVFAFHDENYGMVKGLIAPDMVLSVQANVGAHFTQRHEVYMYPNKVGEADAVVLHLDSPTLLPWGKGPYRGLTLVHHLQIEPRFYLNSIKGLLSRNYYPRVIWKDPWLIFMKGEQTSGVVGDIMNKIENLELEWQLAEAVPNN
jgi:uncharacterized membrane protein